ncbi:MAG: putative glycoside hydrolase [Gaiellaceae bacterium]
MDEQQIAELKRWAERLQSEGDSAELRAAGRALDLATTEIERLRAALTVEEPAAEPAPKRRRRRIFDLEADEDDESEAFAWRPAERAARREVSDSGPNGRPATSVVLERPSSRSPNGAPAARPASERPRQRPPRRERHTLEAIRMPGRGTLIAAGMVAAVAVGAFGAVRIASPDLGVDGPPGNAKIGAAELASLAFAVRADERTLREARWVLDDEDVGSRVVRKDGIATFAGAGLEDGEHWLAVRADGSLPGSSAKHVWHFTIDTSPPQVRIEPTSRKAAVAEPMTFAGIVDEGSTVQVAGRRVDLDEGRFAVDFSEPPAAPVSVLVTDSFGNHSSRSVRVELVPRSPKGAVRAVHVTFYGWANPELRKGVLDLIDQGRINAVELDLKDESGTIGFDAKVPLGRQIGAVDEIYDLREAIDTLHRRGVMVVGRLVAFRDPIHAAEAWKRGWRNQVVQTPAGAPYAGYGGFTNFANPAVRRYNIDIAVAAARAGIDDVLFDYVRRPDGPISEMVFPKLRGTPERSIAAFLAEARSALKPYGTFLGASVFGVAATRPTEVGQDIAAIGRNVDYVSPMVYPSHWGPGEYDVAYPNAEPYAIVKRSLADFEQQVRGTGSRVVPWLQDFTLGVTYGPAEVRAQIDAARDMGVGEFLLWDPNVTYTGSALPPAPKLDPIETKVYTGAPKPQPRATTTAPAASEPAAGRSAASVHANELGEVPVIMYHQIRADGGGDYDLTPAEFRAELERLWRDGYRPVRASVLLSGRMNVPAGKSPVVLTFDDSTKEQLALDEDGEIKPETAIGIMLDFAKRHPGFKPAGTFYVNREPFAGVAEGAELLRWLHEHGFELGNHTKDHIPLNQMSGKEAQRQIVLGARVIRAAVPEANITTFALPLGAWPTPHSIAWRGSWDGESYRLRGVFLVGAEAAKSPFAAAFDPHAIPRIRTTPRKAPDQEWGSSWWLDILKREPGRRYVSDGDPQTISFPQNRAGELAPRFRSRANPY